MATLQIDSAHPPSRDDSSSALPRTAPRLPVIVGSALVIATLHLGRALVLPVVIALLLTLTLSAPVRWLERKHVPGRLAAALVVFGAIGAAIYGATLLASPAMEWIASAPKTIGTLEAKVQHIMAPFTALQRSAERMRRAAAPSAPDAPQTVQLATPGFVGQLSVDSVAAIPIALSVVFLTYFLLANEPLVRRKLAAVLPGPYELQRREHLLGEIELAASRFLATVAVVNIGVGTITALALWGVGVPNPLLWGGIAAMLNFVPYVGPVLTLGLIAVAAIATIDSTGRALLAPAAFLAVHLTETNFVTPFALGRHLPLNTVAMFLGLLFFGWMWGIPGAVLAVPLTVCVKLVCDHVPTLTRVGELLGS